MYLDPAFGGMLLQVVVALVAVGGGIVYSFRRKIKSLFSKGKKDADKVSIDVQDGVIDELSDNEEKSRE